MPFTPLKETFTRCHCTFRNKKFTFCNCVKIDTHIKRIILWQKYFQFFSPFFACVKVANKFCNLKKKKRKINTTKTDPQHNTAPLSVCEGSTECIYSLEGPGIAVTVRLEVFRPHGRNSLKHLHEHHVTHHPEKTCMGKTNHMRPFSQEFKSKIRPMKNFMEVRESLKKSCYS